MTNTWTCWRDASHVVGTHEFGWPQCTQCRAAPPYHERPSFLDERLNLTVYIPTDPLVASMVAPGSALVGLPMGDGRVLVYYEGWIHGAAQYADLDARGKWEGGLDHAASRMVTNYPTSALMSPKAETLTAIGTYNPVTRTVVVDDEESLEGWLA